MIGWFWTVSLSKYRFLHIMHHLMYHMHFNLQSSLSVLFLIPCRLSEMEDWSRVIKWSCEMEDWSRVMDQMQLWDRGLKSSARADCNFATHKQFPCSCTLAFCVHLEDSEYAERVVLVPTQKKRMLLKIVLGGVWAKDFDFRSWHSLPLVAFFLHMFIVRKIHRKRTFYGNFCQPPPMDSRGRDQ